MEVVYEDNHILIVNKQPGEIVQGDKTGDKPLSEILKEWLKAKYNKPGNVFVGVTHRLDRPVAGLVVFAKTSKALSRLNEMFRTGAVEKTYWAVSRNIPEPKSGRLVHYLTSDERTNKSRVSHEPVAGARMAALRYSLIGRSDRYSLIEVKLETGRKHQIRVQLASIGCPIQGDLKYGDKRSNRDGGISLLARNIRFVHPVSGKVIDVTAPVPDTPLWHALEAAAATAAVSDDDTAE